MTFIWWACWCNVHCHISLNLPPEHRGQTSKYVQAVPASACLLVGLNSHRQVGGLKATDACDLMLSRLEVSIVVAFECGLKTFGQRKKFEIGFVYSDTLRCQNMHLKSYFLLIKSF